jgi:hypothetical protein
MSVDNVKPPLGVIPKVIWYEQRICELARAIHDYALFGDYEKVYWWNIEMNDILRCRERHVEQLRPAESNCGSACNGRTTRKVSSLCQCVPHCLLCGPLHNRTNQTLQNCAISVRF